MARTTSTPGVIYVHSRECRDHGRCKKDCNPSPTPWQAWVFDSSYVEPATGKRGKKIRRRFDSHAAAKGWRADALGQLRNQTLRAVDTAVARQTLAETVSEWLRKAETGEILNKREQRYKPAVLRNYELALRLRVLPHLGHRRLTEVTLAHLIALKEQLQGEGVSGSTLRNSFVPLQAIYRWARLNGRVVTDPTVDLPLPTAERRDRAASPQQAAEYLSALPDLEQALWACAFYAGLRRGELRALRVRNVDLDEDHGSVTVEHSWDDREGEILPKTRAGIRKVFLLDVLRPYLAPLVEGRGPDELVFGHDGGKLPFDPRAVDRKAKRQLDAIDKARAEEHGEGEELPPLARWTLHEARHSFSTWMDHCGVSPDRADRYMGHSSGSVASRYRHLLPSQMAEDGARLDAWLAGSAAGKIVALAAAAGQ